MANERRVSIDELERILNQEEDVAVEILPNGEIRAKDTTTSAERNYRKPLTMREDLGGEYATDHVRLRSDVSAAAAQFDAVELRSRTDHTLFLKFALRTTPGNTYVGTIDLSNYPSSMPTVTITAPEIDVRSPHRYTTGCLCYMHPSFWNPGKHDLVFVLAHASKWLNKYEVWRRKQYWPGAELAH